MAYQVLTKDQQDEILVQFLEAQERDHFCHTINAERYQNILSANPPKVFADRIQGLLNETNTRLVEVEHIITQTNAQIVSQNVDIAAALTRIAAKVVP